MRRASFRIYTIRLMSYQPSRRIAPVVCAHFVPALALAALAVCAASAQIRPRPQTPPPERPPAENPQGHPPGLPEPDFSKLNGAKPGELPTFEFRSGFWTNLHHFLYEQAALRRKSTNVVIGGGAEEARAVFVPAAIQLGAEEQRSWNSALDYYSQNMVGKDLLQNGDMVAINNVLATLGACSELSGTSDPKCTSGLQPAMIAALTSAAPVYRAHWWSGDDRANHEWISKISVIIAKWGTDVSQQLSAAYSSPWPVQRIVVDVVGYGGPFGAYTSLNPLHITISSRDPRNQGAGSLAGFEVLFHEASHSLAENLNRAISDECRRRGKLIPRDLWHAVIFYTTGEIVLREITLGSPKDSPQVSEYQPYGARYGLFMRGWSQYLPMLQMSWQPYLDGRIQFDAAVSRMVSSL